MAKRIGLGQILRTLLGRRRRGPYREEAARPPLAGLNRILRKIFR